MPIINSEFVFIIYIKRDNKYILGGKPLILTKDTDNDNNKDIYGLIYIRDIEFSVLLEEGEEIEIGLIRVPKRGSNNIVYEITKNNSMSNQNILLIKKFKYKVHIKNKRKILKESIRGDDLIHTDKFNLHVSYMLYHDSDVKVYNKKDKEYILTIPQFTINHQYNSEFKLLI